MNAACEAKLQAKQEEADKARDDSLQALACARADKDAEIQVLTMAKDAEIETLTASAKAESDQLKAKCKTIIETSQSQLHAFKKEKEAEFEAMKLQLNTELVNKQKVHDIEQKGAADAMEALENTKAKEIDSLNTTADKNLSQLRQERAAEEEKLNNKVLALEKTNSQLTSQITVSNDQDSLIKSLTAQSGDHEAARKTLQEQLETTCNDFTKQADESKVRLDSILADHAALTSEIDSAHTDAAVKRDLIHELEIQN